MVGGTGKGGDGRFPWRAWRGRRRGARRRRGRSRLHRVSSFARRRMSRRGDGPPEQNATPTSRRKVSLALIEADGDLKRTLRVGQPHGRHDGGCARAEGGGLDRVLVWFGGVAPEDADVRRGVAGTRGRAELAERRQERRRGGSPSVSVLVMGDGKRVEWIRCSVGQMLLRLARS